MIKGHIYIYIYLALTQRDFCIFLLFYYTKQQQQTLPYTGTRPALTMSVPVRYSAAAEYAVVDSGLDNTLTQEEQYHQQQQQLHQQQLEHQQLQYAQYQQQQQQEEEEALLYCQLQQQLEAEQHTQALRQQQEQLMQQRSSMLMSSTGMPSLDLPHNNKNNSNNNSNHINNNANNNMDAISINAILVDDEQPSTSAQAAAAILRGKSMNGGGIELVDHNAEMPTDWMRIADEGRYGTPGAAGLEYQKYEQQQQQPLEAEAAAGQRGWSAGAEPTALKKLEDQLHALSSDELYETLKEYDVLQDKYHTVLLLPKESRVSLCQYQR